MNSGKSYPNNNEPITTRSNYMRTNSYFYYKMLDKVDFLGEKNEESIVSIKKNRFLIIPFD